MKDSMAYEWSINVEVLQPTVGDFAQRSEFALRELWLE